MVPERVRQRYMQDLLPVRLGGLAADLARVASFAENPKNHHVVAGLLEESTHFAEWAAAVAPVEVQEQLAQVQITVAWWHLRLRKGRPEPSMPAEAQRWSERLLQLSGLVS